MYQIKEWLKMMFVYPRLQLEAEDYDTYWKDKRGDSIGAISDWQIERADFVIDNVSKDLKVSICDIACGDGSILNYISKKIDVGELLGTDISEFALKRAQQFGIKTINLDIEDKKLLFKIPSADYLLMFEILEHIPHSEDLLKEAYSKSKMGIFFSFPNTGFFVHRFRLFFGSFPLQWRLFPGEHVRFWTLRDLKWWLKNLGFKNYKIKTYKGLPILNKIWPSMFAAGFVVYVPKN